MNQFIIIGSKIPKSINDQDHVHHIYIYECSEIVKKVLESESLEVIFPATFDIYYDLAWIIEKWGKYKQQKIIKKH